MFFAGALVVDWGGIYLTSREGNWRIHSAPHWTERHGLFIILAIGESVVAIGVGAAGQPISAPLLVSVGVLLLALPAAVYLPPLVGLVLLLGVLIGVETRRYAALRADVRPG